VAPLGEIPKEFQPVASKEAEQETRDKQVTTEPATELSEKAAPKSAQNKLNVKDLAFTKDASDIEYKALVEQISFKSKMNVKSFCAELAHESQSPGLDQPRQRPDYAGLFNTQAETRRRWPGDFCASRERREQGADYDRGARLGRKVTSGRS
jgi:hypothetical protein